MDLYNQFLQLPCGSSESTFTAIPLSASRKDFLAKGLDGAPVFLVHDDSEKEYTPSVNFKHLIAQFHATCQVCTDDVEIEDQFALVTCEASASDLFEIFIRCFKAAIEDLPNQCDTKELSTVVRNLIDLFRTLSLPSGKEISGLWAELFILAHCSDVPAAMLAWHNDPFERFDFSWEGGCLEVKSSTLSARIHHFSLEQLTVPANGSGVVASVLLQPLSGGIGVLDLARTIEAHIQSSPILKQKLWSNVAKALGSEFSERLDKQFDLTYAQRSIVFYQMDDIPKPDAPSDLRIVNIRFTVDITDVKASSTDHSRSRHDRIFWPIT